MELVAIPVPVHLTDSSNKMKTLRSALILSAIAISVFSACDGVQKDPLEKQGASDAVRPAKPENWQDTTMADTSGMDRMDTATDPSMDGKP